MSNLESLRRLNPSAALWVTTRCWGLTGFERRWLECWRGGWVAWIDVDRAGEQSDRQPTGDSWTVLRAKRRDRSYWLSASPRDVNTFQPRLLSGSFSEPRKPCYRVGQLLPEQRKPQSDWSWLTCINARTALKSYIKNWMKNRPEKAQLAKASAAKPRVLISFSQESGVRATKDLKTAGLPKVDIGRERIPFGHRRR